MENPWSLFGARSRGASLRVMQPVTREALLESITYALWRGFRHHPRKSERMEEARRLAAAVVEHLEQCRIECQRPDQPRGHSTP